MNTTAIIIPSVIFLIATIMQVVLAIRYGVKGKDFFKSSPTMTVSKRKELLAFVCLYICLLSALIFGAVYVISDNIWLSFFLVFLWTFFSITMVMAFWLMKTAEFYNLNDYPLDKRAAIALGQFAKWMNRGGFVYLILLYLLFVFILVGIAAVLTVT